MPPEPATQAIDDAGQPPADPGPGAPAAPPGPAEATSVSTLLHTAATSRPLEEVAALVELLRNSDGDSGHGDEALRVAAVDRPVSEVGPLVALLDGSEHATASAHQALRAAALGRSVEEVAQLIETFGARGGDDASTAAPTPVGATATAAVDAEAAAEATAAAEAGVAGDEGADADARGPATDAVADAPTAADARADADVPEEAPLPGAAAVRPVRIPVDADPAPSPEGQVALAGPAGVAAAGDDDAAASGADSRADTVAAPVVAAGANGVPVRPAPAAAPRGVAMPTAVPVTWGTTGHRNTAGAKAATPAAPDAGRQDAADDAPAPRPGRVQAAAPGWGLRWPAAVTLAACGLSHLPVAGMRQFEFGRPADVLSLVIVGGCLVLAGWLAVRGTAAAWAASAAAAVTVIVLHLASRVGVVHPLRSVLGDAAVESEVLAVALALVSAGFAAAALAGHRRRAPAPAAGA